MTIQRPNPYDVFYFRFEEITKHSDDYSTKKPLFSGSVILDSREQQLELSRKIMGSLVT